MKGSSEFTPVPCGRCGFVKHHNDWCPAQSRVCWICEKRGHYARMCRSNQEKACKVQVNSIKRQWIISPTIENIPVNLKVDTGSEVNAIPKELYDARFSHIPLQQSSAELRGYFGQCVKPAGTVHMKISYKQRVSVAEFMVIDGKTSCILGYESCVALGLIDRVVEVLQSGSSDRTILDDDKYKSLFKGLGCIKGAVYDAKMSSDVKPVIMPPRKVPHPLMKTLKEALDKLVRQDIIEPVTEPTEWVNALVVVEKKNGDLRLCIDPRCLNKGICREHYPMRTVEDVAACLQTCQPAG